MLLYIVWGVQKTQNLTKEFTYRVGTLIWPFYFNLDLEIYLILVA